MKKLGKNLLKRNLIIKKGAMFGLDARIALLIFSSVSLLASAVIIGTYKEIKYDKVFSEAYTISQGLTMLMKDLNVSIYDSVDKNETLDNKELFSFENLLSDSNVIASFKSRWNGPYIKINYKENIEPTLNSKFRLARLAEDLSTTCNDSKSNPCYIYLKFKDVEKNKCNYLKDLSTVKKMLPVKTQEDLNTCDLFIKLTLDY